MLYFTVLYHAILYCSVLLRTVVCCTEAYCTVLYHRLLFWAFPPVYCVNVCRAVRGFRRQHGLGTTCEHLSVWRGMLGTERSTESLLGALGEIIAENVGVNFANRGEGSEVGMPTLAGCYAAACASALGVAYAGQRMVPKVNTHTPAKVATDDPGGGNQRMMCVYTHR